MAPENNDPGKDEEQAADEAADASPRDAEKEQPAAWQELRSLLVGPERERIREVEEKLDTPWLHADEVSQLLPEAVSRSVARNDELGKALGPVVGEAIRTSVRKDPQPLVDAIFPIIGPAIRRAIASSFSELVQSMNAAMEHSLTPRGIRWRIEAMRTGRSFGEVVLSHSLVYRVEQLFLIDRESGLLISHQTAPGVKAQSPEMVSGMLTAITDFIRDSFEVEEKQELDSLALGDVTVWVEHGPRVALAAVIRGQAPVALRTAMQRAVENLHRYHAADIDAFRDKGTGFEPRTGLLEPLLQSQAVQREQHSGWRLAIAGLILLGLAGWCVTPRVLAARKFNAYVADLRAEPGIVVTSAERSGGVYQLTGLRDPLARDPAELRELHRLSTSELSERWEPYVALRPEFVVERARRSISPPATVELSVRGDTLVATGVAAEEWRRNAARTAALVAGVSALDTSALRDSVENVLTQLADHVALLEVRFPLGEILPESASVAVVDSMSQLLRQLARVALANGRRVSVLLRAAADTTGSEEVNAALRLARSRTVRAMLLARGVPSPDLSAVPDSSLRSRVAVARVTISPIP